MLIEELRELVHMEDIPSPTVPEYKEHHASIQKILQFIDANFADKVIITKRVLKGPL